MVEVWKDIKNYENYYQVSNLGRIKSLDRVVNSIHGDSHKKGKLKKLTLNKKGYLKVSLFKNGKSQTREVQRYVAEAFIPNPNYLEQVNHINGDKTNNCINNLEWISPLENTRHSINILGKNHKIKVNQYDLDGNYIATYESVKEAGLKNNIKPFNISLVLKNKRHRAGGYKWKYYES